VTERSNEALLSIGLFTGVPQHENFPRLKDIAPVGHMTPSSRPEELPEGAPIALPATYTYDGVERSIEEFFADTDTAALLILQDGAVRLERYALTGGRDVQWISWSVAKSYVSALVGIAVAEGHIRDIEEPISEYVPLPVGSAYHGVAIRHVLQMSSGARWNEDYSDPGSEIHRLGAMMAGLGSLDEFVAGMVRESEPGTVCRYNSGETQALGSLLVAATGRSITDYMQEKLCEPLGMTGPGDWLLDRAGMEMAFAGLNLTARDFARIGELYRNDGVCNGRQVVPRDWVRASVVADAPHLQPGRPLVGDHALPFGYGYQWWLPAGDRGEFAAIGVYNQFVFVDRSRRAVIVKLSANRAYGTTNEETTNREEETVEFLRAILRQLDE
jgi:CubicO group peptidase (beta-lactamase class C family)